MVTSDYCRTPRQSARHLHLAAPVKSLAHGERFGASIPCGQGPRSRYSFRLTSGRVTVLPPRPATSDNSLPATRRSRHRVSAAATESDRSPPRASPYPTPVCRQPLTKAACLPLPVYRGSLGIPLSTRGPVKARELRTKLRPDIKWAFTPSGRQKTEMTLTY